MKPKLTEADFAKAALSLGVPVASVKAFAEVESRGDGFLPDGHPVVLFERHVMYKRTKAKYGFTRADALVKRYPDIINPKSGGYGKESEQPGRMARAASLIDRECALESASWGLFQVMGYHWEAMGYPSLQAFINAMYYSEGDHLEAFVRYIKMTPSLHRALKAQDWPRVALGYNGPDYAANKYDTKLAAAFARHSTA
jgi:hypothetical protein